MKRALEVLCLALISAGLFSCGGGRPNAPSGSISASSAKSFATTYSSHLSNGANGFNATNIKNSYVTAGTRRIESLMQGVLPNAEIRDLGCTPTESGDLTDADKDGVKVNAVYTFTNCAATLGKFSGSFTFQDADDSKALPLAGFRFRINDFKFELSAGGQSVSVSSSGFFNVAVTDKTATVAEEMVMSVSAGNSSADLGAWLDTTATANSATAPDQGGTLTFSGFFKLSAGQAGDYVLGISSQDLTYSSSCSSTFFNNGTISLVDGSKNTLKATYTNCTPAWTYNGAALSLTR